MSFQIFIKEKNAKLPFKKEELEKVCRLTFKMTKKKEGDVSLVVCDNSFIKKLNEKYKKEKGPTDVLSFSMREGEFSGIGSNLLGDIIVSMEMAKMQADKLGETLKEEFFILFIHGLLHLLGFNHNNGGEEKIMMDYTREIILGVNQLK